MATKATKKNTEMTVAERREAYKAIAKRSEQKIEDFNQAVQDLLAKKGLLDNGADFHESAYYLWAAKRVSFPCERCAGTGQFITGTVNGKPTGPGGMCFRCKGKGRQTDADRRRNYGYDCRMIAREAKAMMGPNKPFTPKKGPKGVKPVKVEPLKPSDGPQPGTYAYTAKLLAQSGLMSGEEADAWKDQMKEGGGL